MGFVTGAFSGVVHVWLRIPSFIVTLATSGLVAAAALLLSQERSITISETGRAYLSWITGRPFGIPSVILIGALVAGVGIWLQRYTPFGRYSTAIGAGAAPPPSPYYYNGYSYPPEYYYGPAQPAYPAYPSGSCWSPYYSRYMPC